MKKVINVKEIMIILISLVLITISSSVIATNPLVIGSNEYDNAQTPTVDNGNNASNTGNTNTSNNITNNNATNNVTNNSVKKYNTNNSNTDLPQTGIEDYNVGILLVICIASAIYAYKKINDYRTI